MTLLPMKETLLAESFAQEGMNLVRPPVDKGAVDGWI